MNCTLYLAISTLSTTLCLRIVSTEQLLDGAILVLNNLIAGDEITSLESYLVAREKSKVLLNRIFHEILSVNP